MMFAGGGAPRVEVYSSFKALAAAVEAPLVFGLRGVMLKEEEEDKFNTRIYCLEQQQDMPSGEDGLSVLRFRMDDRVKAHEEEKRSPAAALHAAVSSAIPNRATTSKWATTPRRPKSLKPAAKKEQSPEPNTQRAPAAAPAPKPAPESVRPQAICRCL